MRGPEGIKALTEASEGIARVDADLQVKTGEPIASRSMSAACSSSIAPPDRRSGPDLLPTERAERAVFSSQATSRSGGRCSGVVKMGGSGGEALAVHGRIEPGTAGGHVRASCNPSSAPVRCIPRSGLTAALANPTAKARRQAHAAAPGYESGINLENAGLGRARARGEHLEFASSDEDPGETPNRRKVTADFGSGREVAVEHVILLGVGEAVEQPHWLVRHFPRFPSPHDLHRHQAYSRPGWRWPGETDL
jgi:hypothetical protein